MSRINAPFSDIQFRRSLLQSTSFNELEKQLAVYQRLYKFYLDPIFYDIIKDIKEEISMKILLERENDESDKQ